MMVKIKNNYSGNILKLKNLSVEELIETYRRSGNSAVLNLIVKKTEKLAYKIAGDSKYSQWEKKDIVQVALGGLLIAINRFDTKSNIKFSTFAFHYIRGEILHYIRDGGLVKSPRWIWKLNKIFNDYVKEYEVKNDRYPTIEEISEDINISVEGVNEFLKAREAYYYCNRKTGEKKENIDKEKAEASYDRSLIKSREYRSFDLVLEDRIILWDAIDRLRSLNKKIVVLSYFSGLSQKEIGEQVGISQRSVSRKLSESINILREYLT